MEPLHGALEGWAEFYLITGGAAAALTGLQFVVQTLIASEALRTVMGRDPEGGISAFGTPTVVHFTLGLVVSAMMCAPWESERAFRGSIAAVGAGALIYAVAVLRRTRRQRGYVPTFEDWLCHVVLPMVAYGGLLWAAATFEQGRVAPLFAVGGATLLLLCVGIHNAWDTVTFLTIRMLGEAPAGIDPPRPAARPTARRRRRH